MYEIPKCSVKRCHSSTVTYTPQWELNPRPSYAFFNAKLHFWLASLNFCRRFCLLLAAHLLWAWQAVFCSSAYIQHWDPAAAAAAGVHLWFNSGLQVLYPEVTILSIVHVLHCHWQLWERCVTTEIISVPVSVVLYLRFVVLFLKYYWIHFKTTYV
jgi:hypothetical protein